VKVSFVLQPWQDLLPSIAGPDGYVSTSVDRVVCSSVDRVVC
jgi:hypothetical protein